MDVPNTFPALFWCYSIVWVVIVAYTISLVVRLRRIERKLDDAKK